MDKIKTCLDAVSLVIGEAQQEIPLHTPIFKGNEWQYVKDCIDSGWVSSVGEYVNQFEQKIVEFTGAPYAIAAVNGTAALHIALLLAGVSKDDEVLVPALTFIATANAVIYCNAIPHFIDSNCTNLGIDLEKLEKHLAETTFIQNNYCFNKHTQRRIKAIIPVHIFGHPVDMEALKVICHNYHLTIVEDASESLGSYYKGKHTGNLGEIATLSFNGNKIISTGGGGAILTDNEEIAKRAKHLTTTAKKPHRWEFYHDEVGYNYRLPNINAALGCGQMEQLPTFIEHKRHLAQKYLSTFKDITFGSILAEPENSQSNYWLNAFILNEPNRSLIEQLIETANECRYGLRGLWTPLDLLPMYKDAPRMDLSTTHALFNRVICLPSSAHLWQCDSK